MAVLGTCRAVACILYPSRGGAFYPFIKEMTPDAARASGVVSLRSFPLLEETEDVQLTALRDMIEASGNRETDPAADAGIHADILLAADFPGGRVADDA